MFDSKCGCIEWLVGMRMIMFVLTCIDPFKYIPASGVFWLTSWQAVLLGNKFNAGQYLQTWQPKSFIPAMFVGTIDLCHCIPLLVTMIMVGDHEVIRKQKLLVSLSCISFRLIRMKFDVVLKLFRLIILILSLIEMYVCTEHNCWFTDGVEALLRRHAFRLCEQIWSSLAWW